jgi:hypothetical protein
MSVLAKVSTALMKVSNFNHRYASAWQGKHRFNESFNSTTDMSALAKVSTTLMKVSKLQPQISNK